jgi:Cu/Ag efflux protein CusF
MQQTTPLTRSRLPFIAIGVWAALLVTLVAISLAFGNRPAGNATAGAGGDPNQANLIAPIQAASPSAGASAAPVNGDGNWRGPGGIRGFGPDGPKGFGGITITGISGSQLSLKTGDGWTRTIDATGATITEQGGTAITLGDLKTGDQIAFRQTRNSDGTFKITDIVRIPPQAAGTVKSVDASSATLTLPDGSTKTIGLTSSTTYNVKGKAATAADLKAGVRIHAVGTVDANGAFTATRIDIAPAVVAGIVTAKSGNSITLKDRSGGTITVNVDSSTTYQSRGTASASLADVAVGDVLNAEGTLNSDGSLNATAVQYGAAGAGVYGAGKGHGFGPGRPFRGPFGGRNQAPNPSPSATTSGG